MFGMFWFGAFYFADGPGSYGPFVVIDRRFELGGVGSRGAWQVIPTT